MFALRCASVLFFASGATGLVYEIIWFRRFALVWGNSSLAVAAVVASFLGGLALGAHLAGRRADRIARPLRAYGWLEIAIGALALLVPYLAALQQRLAGALYPLFESAPALYAVVEVLLTFLAIGPPTILMGATLPLIVRRFGRVGWMYGVNTAGAACGCLAAGFLLLPALGLARTNLLAALLNGAIGVVALLLARRVEPLPPAAPKAARAPRKVLAAAACAGAGALTLQVVWNRQLAVLVGGSTYAFSAVLFVILLGIGVGALLCQRWPPRKLGLLVLLLLATAALGNLSLSPLTEIVGEVRRLRARGGFNAAVCIAAAAALQLVPALVMGILFPAFVERASGRVGRIYAVNTAGAITGALLATLLFVPVTGTAGALTIGLVFYLVALFLLEPQARLALLAGVVILVPATRRADPMVTDIGTFLYGTFAEDEEHTRLFFREGAALNVLVRENASGSRALHLNGKPDASNSGDMPMQLGLAYVPRFLRPAGKDVLVLGLGSGTTAGASLLFPDTNVTCCEIEPEVFSAHVLFDDVNHRPAESPRFRMVFNDGRHHLQGTGASYDLILSEPSNPWMAGISNLFTREFYVLARDRLRPGGVLAQWIQTYALSPREYALIVRTVGDVFPHLALARIGDGDTFLIAGNEPLLPTRASLDAARALAAHCAADLLEYFERPGARGLLARHVVLGDAAVRRLAGRGELNTDANLRLEFDAPRRLFGRDGGLALEQWIFAEADGEWQRALLRAGAGQDVLAGLAGLVDELLDLEQPAAALRVARAVLESVPDAAWFRATRLVHERPANTFAFRRDVVALAQLSEDEASRAGRELYERGEPLLSVEVFRVLSVRRPDSAATWAWLARSERQAGNRPKADAALGRALELDPLNEFVRQTRDEWD